MCIKITYEAIGKIKGKENESAQALENLRVIGFYLGDDGKRKDLEAAPPQPVADLECMMTQVVIVTKAS